MNNKNIPVCILIICFSACISEGAYAALQVKEDKNTIAKINDPVLNPKAGDIWKEPTAGIEFVWIPAGCFKMGNIHSDQAKFGHEKPVRNVCLDGFWMGRFEVTNAQFRKYKPGHNSGNYKSYSLNEDKQPVVLVSWNRANNFASWLTQKSRRRHTYRLPTEAEWEYACRAGTITIRYWGQANDVACKHANIGDKLVENEPADIHLCQDGFFQASYVGSFPPNQFGLYDMLGNVWEWCEDVYGKDTYKTHKRNNPVYERFEIGIDFRVIRGGSWQSGPDSVRCAKRSYNLPTNKFDVLGFRIVVEP